MGAPSDLRLLLAASNDCHSTQLTWCAPVSKMIATMTRAPKVPLWNLSSIGGTIMRTFLSSSLVVADILGESGIILAGCNG